MGKGGFPVVRSMLGPLGVAIGYALDNRDAVTICTTDGRLPIDNNAVERAIRPVALGRKDWLFAGSERGG